MAPIPPGYLNAVVSLGRVAGSFNHDGTGLFYAHPLPSREGHTPYRYFLVTNKRVAEIPVEHFRFNRPAAGLTVEPIEAGPEPRSRRSDACAPDRRIRSQGIGTASGWVLSRDRRAPPLTLDRTQKRSERRVDTVPIVTGVTVR